MFVAEDAAADRQRRLLECACPSVVSLFFQQRGEKALVLLDIHMWIAELLRTLRKQLFCHPAGGSKFALLGEQLYQSAPECQAFDMCFTEGLARVGLTHADGQFGIAAVAVRSEALRQRAQGRQIFGEGHGFEWSRARTVLQGSHQAYCFGAFPRKVSGLQPGEEVLVGTCQGIVVLDLLHSFVEYRDLFSESIDRALLDLYFVEEALQMAVLDPVRVLQRLGQEGFIAFEILRGIAEAPLPAQVVLRDLDTRGQGIGDQWSSVLVTAPVGDGVLEHGFDAKEALSIRREYQHQLFRHQRGTDTRRVGLAGTRIDENVAVPVLEPLRQDPESQRIFVEKTFPGEGIHAGAVAGVETPGLDHVEIGQMGAQEVVVELDCIEQRFGAHVLPALTLK